MDHESFKQRVFGPYHRRRLDESTANTMVECYKGALKDDDRISRRAQNGHLEVLFFFHDPIFGRGSQEQNFVELYRIPQQAPPTGGGHSPSQLIIPQPQMSWQSTPNCFSSGVAPRQSGPGQASSFAGLYQGPSKPTGAFNAGAPSLIPAKALPRNIKVAPPPRWNAAQLPATTFINDVGVGLPSSLTSSSAPATESTNDVEAGTLSPLTSTSGQALLPPSLEDPSLSGPAWPSPKVVNCALHQKPYAGIFDQPQQLVSRKSYFAEFEPPLGPTPNRHLRQLCEGSEPLPEGDKRVRGGYYGAIGDGRRSLLAR